MRDILVLGPGKIRSLISGLLAESDDYHVQLGDVRRGAAAEVAEAHKQTSIKAFNLNATGDGTCCVLDLIRSGESQYMGFVAQEEFRLADIPNNHFGRLHAQDGTNNTSAELVARGETGHQRAKKVV